MRSKTEIENFMVNILTEILDIDASKIDKSASLEDLSLSSSSVVSLIGELEEFIDEDLSPSVLFEYNTIEALTTYLSSKVSSV